MFGRRSLRSHDLSRDEVLRLWSIDRTEVIDGIYRIERGELVLERRRIDVRGWPAEDVPRYMPRLLDCCERGGWLRGVFAGDRLIAAAVLDNRRIGPRGQQRQLEFLYVGAGHRGAGLGRQLFEQARTVAREWGAQQVYVSATPSRNTIEFYLRRGCRLAERPDPELLALEPDDIHLVCDVDAVHEARW